MNITCPDIPVLLDPEAHVPCSGQHSLTQEDVDRGAVTSEVCCLFSPLSREGFGMFAMVLAVASWKSSDASKCVLNDFREFTHLLSTFCAV